jgi:glycosyltransferase involved in cell wall biosynthesis
MPSLANSVSVIVTAHNCGRFLPRTLGSVVDAVDALSRQQNSSPSGTEVVLVDDGSTDDTPRICHHFASTRSGWRVIRRPRASSPSAARNAGVRASSGAILFFLDGDDLFLPEHLAACCRVLTDNFDFVKTGVRLADPVHPDWQERIANSLVRSRQTRSFLGLVTPFPFPGWGRLRIVHGRIPTHPTDETHALRQVSQQFLARVSAIPYKSKVTSWEPRQRDCLIGPPWHSVQI